MINFYDWIEPYNLGRLGAAEARRFEAEMENDPALAAATHEHRAQWEAQELLAENLLRAELRQQFAQLQTRPWWTRRKLALPLLLALLLLLLAAGWWLNSRYAASTAEALPTTPAVPLRDTVPVAATDPLPVTGVDTVSALPGQPATQRTPDLRQLAMASYQAPESLGGVRGAPDDDVLGPARTAFKDRRYRRVVALLDSLPADQHQEALALRAHAYFGAREFAAAARDFAALEAGGVYRRDAEWFALLARMARPGADTAALKRELEAIRRQPNHPYRGQAKKLWEAVSGEK